MLRTVDDKTTTKFHSALTQVFDGPGRQLLIRTLTTPGGPIENAQLIWWAEPGVWAYFSPKPYDGRRWLCWYGIDPGSAGKSLQPAVEINISTDPSYKQVSGRALVDASTGGYFLGHKGGLGGGRGGQMALGAFAQEIQEFSREITGLGDEREEEIFVIGALEDPDFLQRLKAYVSECARLRKVARLKTLRVPVRAAAAGKKGVFKPELDQDGFQNRTAAETRAIARRHGRVVNALAKRLGEKAINTSRSRIRPDLYVEDSKGRMVLLFEVKASSDSQSWFTALGQLVVYGANEAVCPRRVLVCPGPLQDPSFGRALKELKVDLVSFREEARKGIVFEDLDPVLQVFDLLKPAKRR